MPVMERLSNYEYWQAYVMPDRLRIGERIARFQLTETGKGTLTPAEVDQLVPHLAAAFVTGWRNWPDERLAKLASEYDDEDGERLCVPWRDWQAEMEGVA